MLSQASTPLTPVLLWTWITVGLVSLILSALYSGIETGVYCLDPIKLRLHGERGPRLSRWLAAMLVRRERLLVVLLIGNNVANYGSTAAAAILLAQTMSPNRAELLTALLVTPVLFVVGEMVPKNLFQRFADRLVYRWLWLLRSSQILFTIVGLVPTIGWLTDLIVRIGRRGTHSADVLGAREQLHAFLRETATAGVLSGYQSQIARNVLNVSGVTAGDVMTPLRRVQMLPHDATAGQFHRLAAESRFSRWPVYRRGHRSRIVGVVNVDEVLLAEPERWDLPERWLEPMTLTSDVGVLVALLRLQRARRTMAIVVDERDRAVGIVTLKDLVEEIVGDLVAW